MSDERLQELRDDIDFMEGEDQLDIVKLALARAMLQYSRILADMSFSKQQQKRLELMSEEDRVNTKMINHDKKKIRHYHKLYQIIRKYVSF